MPTAFGLLKRQLLCVITAYFAAASPVWAVGPEGSAAPAVTVIQAMRDCFVDTVQVTGIVLSRHDILVRPSREGLQISEILVQPGDTVIAGQVLARLKASDLSKDIGSGGAVTAPDAGVVYSTSAVIGASATAAGEPLFRIAKDAEMELSVETPVNTMGPLAVNQAAHVEVIGIGEELSGKVRFIAAEINQTTQLGEVRLSLAQDQRLRVGTFGQAKIEIGKRCGAAIPLSAVLFSEDGAVVQVVRDDRIESRRVTVGSLKDGEIEIRNGIVEGEMAVARAGAFVRDGDPIRAIPSLGSFGR